MKVVTMKCLTLKLPLWFLFLQTCFVNGQSGIRAATQRKMSSDEKMADLANPNKNINNNVDSNGRDDGRNNGRKEWSKVHAANSVRNVLKNAKNENNINKARNGGKSIREETKAHIHRKALEMLKVDREENKESSTGRKLKKSKVNKGRSRRNYDDDDDRYDKYSKSGKNNSRDDGGRNRSRKGGNSNKRGSNDRSPKRGHNGECTVTLTNLSYEQSLSDIFLMVHDRQSHDEKPLFVFGNRTSSALADLAQDLDTRSLVNMYENREGVDQIRVISDFGRDRTYLQGGARVQIEIDSSRSFNRLTLAAGFPFANDGIVALQNELIYDGAMYYLPGIDVGVEANLQTCWSVPATQADFPSNAQCSTAAISDQNDNSLGGEGFVHIHRGMQDLDTPADLTDLQLIECFTDIPTTDPDRFFQYFNRIPGYDDDVLLCQAVTSGNNCLPRRDDDFIRYVQQNDDLGTDDVLLTLVSNSNTFDEFCEDIATINDGIVTTFITLEPTIFDWRNTMALVEIDCER